MQLDPVISLLVGALGASLIGLFGAWVQSRREHARWLREKRYEGHLAFLRLTDRHTTNAQLGRGPKTKDDVKEAIEEINEVVSAISLIGPETLLAEARRLRAAAADFIATGKEPEMYPEIRAAYVVVSRNAIGVSSRG